MRGNVAIGDMVAWLLLLPGNLACRALGLADHDLVRMLVNSLFWTTFGVLIAVFAA
jgi:hypothetical protein